MRTFPALIAATLAAVATPAAAQETTGFPSLDDMRRAVTQMRERMFTPGAAVPDWNRGGANPDADLRRAGPDRFYYRLRRAGGDGVVVLTDRPLASFVPAGWRAVDTYGDSAARVDNPVIQFEPLSARYVIGLRAGSARRGDTDCVDSIANATLYERPDVAAGPDDAEVPLYFRLTLIAGEGQTVCTRYEGDRAAGWRSRAFLPDGHALPQLDDEGERITIVPAAPIDRLIVYRAPLPEPLPGA